MTLAQSYLSQTREPDEPVFFLSRDVTRHGLLLGDKLNTATSTLDTTG